MPLKFNPFTGTFDLTGTAGGAGTPAGSSGAVQFNSSGSFGADDSNFFWDDTNNRLGIGLNTPSVALEVSGDIKASTSLQGGAAFFGMVSGYNGVWIVAPATPTLSNYSLLLEPGASTDFNTPAGTSLDFRIGNGRAFKIWHTTGRVSIGDLTPLAKIHLESPSQDALMFTYSAQDYRHSISTYFDGGIAAGNQMRFKLCDASTSGQVEVLVITGAKQVGVNTTAPGASLGVTIPISTDIGQIIKAATSQSANLQEWQNSSSVVQSSIDSSGYGFIRDYNFALAIGVAATTGTNKTNELIISRNGKIKKAFAYAKTGPTGQAIIFDINLNGASIWASTQANRIQIAAGANSGTQTSFDTTAITEGDRLTIDIDQIGSGVAGQDITIVLLCLLRNQ